MRSCVPRWFVVLFCLTTLIGCSEQEDRSDSTPTADPDLNFVNVLRETTSFDFDPLPSPEALRSAVDFAGSGHIYSVQSALIDEPAGPDTGAVVIGVQSEEVWKTDGAKADSGVFYFVVRRPTNVSADVFAQSLVDGTRVALFGDVSTLSFSEGSPTGVVYSPAPQGLIIETGAASLGTDNVWGGEVNENYPGWVGATTIEGIRAALDLE